MMFNYRFGKLEIRKLPSLFKHRACEIPTPCLDQRIRPGFVAPTVLVSGMLPQNELPRLIGSKLVSLGQSPSQAEIAGYDLMDEPTCAFQ